MGVERSGNVISAYLLSASVYPCFRIGIFNTATNLQSIGPRSERLLRSLVISRSQHDYMSSAEIVLPVKIRIVGSAML